jgi:type IV pilus assembly protein PilA
MRKAFTLVEIIIVVVIIGIIAAFSIPLFGKTISRSKVRDAILNLNVIHASNVIYRMRNGGSNITGAAGVAAINSALSLNILANGATYACTTGTTCTASNVGVTGCTVTATLNTALSTTNPATSSCP